MYLKIAFNVINFYHKSLFDNHHCKNLNIEHLNNLSNPSMNNLLAIDFAMRDYIDDTDLILPRICAEFPRISSDYTSRGVN